RSDPPVKKTECSTGRAKDLQQKKSPGFYRCFKSLRYASTLGPSRQKDGMLYRPGYGFPAKEKPRIFPRLQVIPLGFEPRTLPSKRRNALSAGPRMSSNRKAPGDYEALSDPAGIRTQDPPVKNR